MKGFVRILSVCPAILGCAAAARFAPDPHGQQAPLSGADKADAGAPDLWAKLPLVDSEALQATINGSSLMGRAAQLYAVAWLSTEEHGRPTRVIGSAGHLGTLSYIQNTLAKLGDYYTLSSQSFPVVTGRVYESQLLLGSSVAASASPMSLTPPTPHKEPVSGQLVLVGGDGCAVTDYLPSLKGNIALIRRGSCSFGAKSALAGSAGAVAAVVYNTDSGDLHGTLGTPLPNTVATFGLSGADAAPVLAALQDGKEVDATAYIDAEVSTTVTTNILAQTAHGDPDNCVMLGGHSDSVNAGPGINDDGSGSLALLEIATQLTKFRVNNCVRFAWWSGEEEGLLGSDWYVGELPADENRRIRLFMDYDMLASPNFAYQVYNATDAVNPPGSQALRDLYVNWYQDHGLNYSFIPFDGRSDYDGFIRHGIPGGGIATGAEGVKTAEEELMYGGKAGQWYDPCYHQLCDDVGNLNVTAWEINSKLIAHSVATFALSFDGFPKRADFVSNQVYEKSVKYHGSKLVM